MVEACKAARGPRWREEGARLAAGDSIPREVYNCTGCDTAECSAREEGSRRGATAAWKDQTSPKRRKMLLASPSTIPSLQATSLARTRWAAQRKSTMVTDCPRGARNGGAKWMQLMIGRLASPDVLA